MAALGAPVPVMLPPSGPPPPAAPRLPFGADPGTITGWLLENTVDATSHSISLEMEQCFNRLDSVPADGDPGHDNAMVQMVDEVRHSDTIVTYLTATNICNNEVSITVVHSIGKYSAGFGGSNALHGRSLALLGEMRGDQLPMLVSFDDDPDENLAHALELEPVVVPTEALVDAYFATPTAAHLMPGATVLQGATQINMTNLCPIPLA
jgi:hypothetical protein